MVTANNAELLRSIDNLHTLMGELRQTTGRVEGQLGTFIGQMKVQDERSTEHDARIRKVENRQHWYSGVAAAIGLVAGALGMHVKT
jgi:hypothetical protein